MATRSKAQDAKKPIYLTLLEEALATVERAAGKLDLTRYAKHPVAFAYEVLKVEYLTPQQELILGRLVTHKETNVPAGHGVGKTYLSSIAASWYLLCVEGLTITTAPTKRQVVNLLWGEIRKLHGRRREIFESAGAEVLQTTMRLPMKPGAEARGFTARENSTDGFQGEHATHLLGIQDEANGISEAIDDGFVSCTAGSLNRRLRVGNPTVAGTAFERHCKQKPATVVRLHVFEHVNVAWAYDRHPDGVYRLKPDVAARIRHDDGTIKEQDEWPDDLPRDRVPGAVSVSWIEEARASKGEGSPFWKSRVMAEFPEDVPNAVFPRALLLEARARYDDDPEAWDRKAQQFEWSHGLDVGESGDPHALGSRRGPVLYGIKTYATNGDRETDKAVSYAKAALRDRPGSVQVDNNGIGVGVLSNLQTDGARAIGCNFSRGADNDQTDQYKNLRAQCYWEFRRGLETGEIALAPLGPEEDAFIDELCSVSYMVLRNGQIQIEEKHEIKKRLQRSPDRADAGVSSFRSMPSVVQQQGDVELWTVDLD